MENSRYRRKYVKILRGVRIPTWALCYLINSDDSALDPEDKKTVDDWVEKTRNGGRIEVCRPREGSDEPYFTRHPAFGLACDVEDCDVILTMSPWYPQNTCIRFGQSRFGPVKRTAIDGKTWWCMYDYRDKAYVTWYRFKRRRQALVQLAIDLRLDRLEYEPDPGFGRDWLKSKSIEEVTALVDDEQRL